MQKRAACIGPDLAPRDFSGVLYSPSTQILSFLSWLSKNAIDGLSRLLGKLGGMVDCLQHGMQEIFFWFSEIFLKAHKVVMKKSIVLCV